MGLVEKEDKPFWAKFLKQDYMKEKEESDGGGVLQKVLDVFDGTKKVD